MKKMRNVYLLGITSFLNDLSSEMILPLLPQLIQHAGGTGLALGLIGGLRDSASELLKAFFGIISDRYKTKKPFIYAGYLTSGIFKFLLPLATAWQSIFVLVGLERIGKGLRTAPRDAIIAQADTQRKGKSFGLHRSFDTAGAILGSSITLFLLSMSSSISFSTICMLAGVIACLSAIPIFWVHEPRNYEHQKQYPTIPDMLRALKSIRLLTIIAAIFSLGKISYVFLIAHATNVLSGTSSWISLPVGLYVFYNILYTCIATPIGILSDKIGRCYALTIGYSLFASSMFCFAMATSSFYMLAIGFASYSAAMAFIDVNHKAFVADLTTPRFHASALGVFDTITGLSMLTAGLVCGLLWDSMPHSAMFLYAATMAAIAALLLFCCKRFLTVK